MSLHSMKPICDPDGHPVPSALPTVKFALLHDRARLPIKSTGGAACYDLYTDHDFYFSSALTSRIVHTGVAIELPRNHVGLVCSRSGLAAQQGVFVLNAPGIIDEDYRGEIKIILAYLPGNVMGWPSGEPICFKAGDRIAQLLILRTADLAVVRSTEFTPTDRGTNGFGSTGL